MHLFVFFFQSKTVKIAKKGQLQTFFLGSSFKLYMFM